MKSTLHYALQLVAWRPSTFAALVEKGCQLRVVSAKIVADYGRPRPIQPRRPAVVLPPLTGRSLIVRRSMSTATTKHAPAWQRSRKSPTFVNLPTTRPAQRRPQPNRCTNG